jgi:hypothetical protein
MSHGIDPYPDADFPWHFYFNGELMPKWGALWGMLPHGWFEPEKDWDQEVGHRDVVLISYRLDHVGVVESADPTVFVYAVQEVLYKLLARPDEVMAHLMGDGRYPAEEVYEGLIAAAFQMRTLSIEQKIAFWTNGYEEDREHLVSAMEKSRLPSDDERFKVAPHVKTFERHANLSIKEQIKAMNRLAQAGTLRKEWRKMLHST